MIDISSFFGKNVNKQAELGFFGAFFVLPLSFYKDNENGEGTRKFFRTVLS